MSQIVQSGQPWMELLVVAEPGTAPGSSSITGGPTITMPYQDENGSFGGDDSSNWSLSITNPSSDGFTFVVQGIVPSLRDGWRLCPTATVTFSDGNTYVARLETLQVGAVGSDVVSVDGNPASIGTNSSGNPAIAATAGAGDLVDVTKLLMFACKSLPAIMVRGATAPNFNGLYLPNSEVNGTPVLNGGLPTWFRSDFAYFVWTNGGGQWWLSAAIGNSSAGWTLSAGIVPWLGPWTPITTETGAVALATVVAATDASGNALATSAEAAGIASSLAAITAPPSAAAIANAVLSQGVAAVEGTADPHSLAYVVLAMSEWTIPPTHSNQLTIFRSDGVTPFATKTLSRQANVKPIVGVK